MICKKEECTGCFACFNICPKDAISMIEDEFGYIYPIIDNDKCVGCNLCKKICPQLKAKLDFKFPKKVYAMHLLNLKKRKESTSGGAATAFYEKVLNEGGVVYGTANLFGSSKFNFIRIDDKNELYKVKGSKYVHCYINDAYKEVRQDLNNNKKVLFIGTPCQISGLKSFLINEYENLITIDIVCHGVSSQKLLFDEIASKNIQFKDIFFISFRDEKMYNFKLSDKYKNTLFESDASLVPYYKNFLQGNIFRENCYSCKYAKPERISDITIGDFWGLDKSSVVFDDENKGISLILINTNNGSKLFDKISNDDVITDERTIEEACRNNEQLNNPVKKSKKYFVFREMYPKYGYEKTMKEMKTIKDILKEILKKNRFLLNFYKRINKK